MLSEELIKNPLTPVTSAKKEILEVIDFLEPIAEDNGIVTPLEKAHFFGQLAHESGWFRHSSENLNYSHYALSKVFRKYFPTEDIATAYGRQPEKIANKVYANRMGNGEESSGDGWKYRGRGLIQITGKENYHSYAKDRGVDFVNNPDLIAQPKWAVDSAVWYWNKHNLNKYANMDALKIITRKINGGMNGIEDRQKCVDIFKSIL
ncbi:glycoside hydrolase family 19 protein [Tenacibaculum ovolyticum]|uniref:glycoside hydrolase family 19 protein n=1 Tax=Tenacibaculum ovolyticum TaxID=104270 RepID=UPI0003FF79B6|nr:glycoside hydrolase family 19 protein [Tenacibaculum ovolyticum]